ncbi:DUF6285 domain-containing protein [Leptospira sp. 96542]|nr:DUF6285 domain-containing protein [Leptospira sp. 96542]
MQYRPDTKELISAIQDFLMKDLLPKLEGDDLLSYKTLVSWNMLGVISREIESSDLDLDWKEIVSLPNNLFPSDTKLSFDEFSKLTRKEKYKLLFDWKKNFANQIRQGSIPKEETRPGSAVWNFAKDQLKNNLSVSNPRFQV